MSKLLPAIAIALCVVAALLGLIVVTKGDGEPSYVTCQGAQKRVEDTFKVMDACQQMLGCTITVDDLRKAQEQINQAESCK